jgi:hypothetical protein
MKILTQQKSRLKSLDFKNLNQAKKKEYLDILKKLVLISILIGLECQDPQAYYPYVTLTKIIF